MPELPEVETTVRAINKFEKRVLKKVLVHNRNLRWQVDENIEEYAKNQLINKITRRAKYILIFLNNGCLMIHLGMSGTLRIQNINNNYFKKHDHIEFNFQNEKLIFNDPRRFGSLHFANNPNDHKLIKDLGIEPLSKSFNAKYLYSNCKKSNLSIKKLIMDQKRVVGVGNIYASESLFLSKINPNKLSSKVSETDCKKLVTSIKKILRTAIKSGGTTLQDFYSADGNKGYFKIKLNVYGRDGKKCKKCDQNIKKTVIGQRATFFCDNCQS